MATNVTDAPVPLSIKLEDPKDVFIPRGQPATLKCPYSTTARKSSLRWLCNNTLIPNNDTRRVLQKDGSLYIQKVAGRRYNTTEGSYRCLVSNEFGSILSNPASLKIAGMLLHIYTNIELACCNVQGHTSTATILHFILQITAKFRLKANYLRSSVIIIKACILQ